MFLIVPLELFTNVIIRKVLSKYKCKYCKNKHIHTCNPRLRSVVYLLFGKAIRLRNKLILKGGE